MRPICFLNERLISATEVQQRYSNEQPYESPKKSLLRLLRTLGQLSVNRMLPLRTSPERFACSVRQMRTCWWRLLKVQRCDRFRQRGGYLQSKHLCFSTKDSNA